MTFLAVITTKVPRWCQGCRATFIISSKLLSLHVLVLPSVLFRHSSGRPTEEEDSTTKTLQYSKSKYLNILTSIPYQCNIADPNCSQGQDRSGLSCVSRRCLKVFPCQNISAGKISNKTQKKFWGYLFHEIISPTALWLWPRKPQLPVESLVLPFGAQVGPNYDNKNSIRDACSTVDCCPLLSNLVHC